jgi:hypothetical protein
VAAGNLGGEAFEPASYNYEAAVRSRSATKYDGGKVRGVTRTDGTDAPRTGDLYNPGIQALDVITIAKTPYQSLSAKGCDNGQTSWHTSKGDIGKKDATPNGCQFKRNEGQN